MVTRLLLNFLSQNRRRKIEGKGGPVKLSVDKDVRLVLDQLQDAVRHLNIS